MKRLSIIAALVLAGSGVAYADLQPPKQSEKQPNIDSSGPVEGAEHEEHECVVGPKDPAGKCFDPTEDPSSHYNYFNASYSGKDWNGKKAEEKGYDQGEPMSAPFMFALANFAIFLFLIAKFGGPAAKKIATERHDQIKDALDEAAKLRTQAQDKLLEYDKRIANVDSEIAKLVEGIKADAEGDKKRILAAAEAQAAQMKKDAELRIAAEIEYARARLTNEVSAAATKAAEKLLKDNLQPGDQSKLVSTFIGGLS